MTDPSSSTPSNDALTGSQTPLTGGPVLGLASAAKACGVSLSTLRRRRSDLEKFGAVQTPTGWQIPITALIGAGLMDRVTPPPSSDAPVTPLAWGDDAASHALREELEAMRSRLASAEQRAAVAEAVAAERERLIQSQAAALRMLEAPAAARPETDQAAASAAVPAKPEPVGRPNFWRRLRG